MFNFSKKKEEIIKDIMLDKLKKNISPTDPLPPSINKIANYCIDRLGASNILKIKEIINDISKRNSL